MFKAFALAAVAFASVSVAQARPSTTTMTCAQAADLVQANGAIVLGTGGHTYDRFVSHQGYCGIGEVTRPAWVPTRDSASCFIGYTCSQDNRGGNGG
jgi:hypothetical protein